MLTYISTYTDFYLTGQFSALNAFFKKHLKTYSLRVYIDTS